MTAPPRRPHDHLVEPMFAALQPTADEPALHALERRTRGRWLAVAALALAAAAAGWLWLR